MKTHVIKDRNFGLDLMRALAIMFVLLHHWSAFNLSNIHALNSIIYYMNVFGYLGVEIFFVLSGFLIGNIIIKSYCNEAEYGRKSITRFWTRRWLRTLPLYYFILFVYIAILIIKHTMIPDLWKYFLFLQNIFRYNTTNNDFYGVSWSLSVEEWFYLSFPVLLVLADFSLKKILGKKSIIFSVILLYIILSLLIRIAYVFIEDPSWSNVLRKAVVCREDSIAFGVLGALVHNFRNYYFNHYKGWLFIIGLVLFSVGTVIFIKDVSYNYYYSVGQVSFFSKTALFSLVSFSILLMLPYFYHINCNNIPFKLVVTHISKISYSIYLIHIFFDRVLQRIFHDAHSPVILIAKLFLFLSLSVIGSTITFNLIENTFLKIRDRIWNEKYNAI